MLIFGCRQSCNTLSDTDRLIWCDNLSAPHDKNGDRTSRQDKSEKQAVQAKCDQIVDEVEQLDRIEEGTNQISVDMEDAEKNLEGLEKCCGLCVLPWKRSKKFRRGGEYEKTWRISEDGKVNSQITRMAMGRNAQSNGTMITRITNDAREDEMEENLLCVSGIVGNLRDMAIDMVSEIEYQNRQIDRINYKWTMNNGCNGQDKNGGGSHGYEFRKPVNRMALDDVITADKTDIGYVDIDWDIIQQEKDKLINFASDIKDDVITDMEVEGTDDIFQAAEDTPATSLNLHVMAVVDSQLFRKFLSRNQDDVRQTHNAIVLYFSMIFAMVSS
uniref:Synaptosomal-associated protein n=1 Tax=Magallana gigas TaxID=29159 RepID=K1R5M5_MAGGI